MSTEPAAPGRVYGGLAHAERRERRRERFLDAGLDVFATRGWSSATVLEICRSAGLTQRYFYEDFRSREALFVAVLERTADEVEAAVRVAAGASAQSPDERARGVLSAVAGYVAAEPRAVRVALVESYATPEFRARRAALLAAFSALAAQLMRALHPTPARADRRSLELSAAVLSGGVAEALVAAATGSAIAPESELLEHLTRLYTAAAALA